MRVCYSSVEGLLQEIEATAIHLFITFSQKAIPYFNVVVFFLVVLLLLI